MGSYNINESDFVTASYYALRKARRIIYAIMLLLPLFMLIAGGFTSDTLWLVGTSYAVIILLLLFLVPPIFRFILRRTYRNNSVYHKIQEVTVSEIELNLHSKQGASKYALSELNRIEFHKGIFLIYPASTFYHIIPKKVLTENEAEILEQNIL